jgi:hypothetical protein
MPSQKEMSRPASAPSRLSLLAGEVAYRTRYRVNAYPAVYLPLARVRHRDNPDCPVSRGTELVLEAFGRAGSTFALYGFRVAQPREVRVAHHTHASAQVITAVRWGLPTIVIVRPPVDSALSHMARHRVSARAALQAWVRFHERILPYRAGFVVASFGEMTRDFGAVVARANERFGTSYVVWESSPENEQRIFALINQRNVDRFGTGESVAKSQALARPTAAREALKERMRDEVESPKLATLLARAEGLYTELVGSDP